MSKALLTSVVVALVGAMAWTVLADQGFDSYDYQTNRHFMVWAEDGALRRAPPWKPEAENPPLSPRKAMRLADVKKRQLVKDRADFNWRLRSIELVPGDGDRWFWLVNYEEQPRLRPGTGASGPWSELRLIVLMDGTVVEPEVSPWLDREPAGRADR